MKRFRNVIAFVSGKGGSGKTTSAISLATLLQLVGLRTMIIDFDLVTNGASYFFSEVLEQEQNVGLLEIIPPRLPIGRDKAVWEQLLSDVSWSEHLLVAKQGFSLLASRARFRAKTGPMDRALEWDAAQVLERILESLAHQFQCVLIDCQAGSTSTAQAACSLASKVVVVSENDSISSDAIDNLLVQIGDSFPQFRRYLINKLDIREFEQYRLLKGVFLGMNRLPPLPFDFDVRAAFGSRRIPIDVEEPSPFVFALIDVMKELLPEAIDSVKRFETDFIDKKFVEYEGGLKNLMDQQSSLREELSHIEAISAKLEINIEPFQVISAIVAATGLLLGAFAALGSLGLLSFVVDLRVILITIGWILAAAGYFGLFYSYRKRRLAREKAAQLARREEVLLKLEDIEKQIQMYRSLLLTRSRELLITKEWPHSEDR